ncbi:MAG: hypothetical protein WD990_04520 [Acidimicrobiia bacterium]
MSENLSAAASTMNVPETLVQRSAEARAKATGASVDDVLAAWAGGAAAPAAAAPAETAPAPEPAADATPEPVPAREPETSPAEAPAAAVAPAPSVIAVMELPEDEPVDPVGFRERSRVGGRIGMGFGVLAALFVMLFSAQWLLARSGATETEAGEISFVFSVVPGTFIIGSALLGAALGAVGAGFVRALTGWRAAGMRLVSSHASSLLAGAVAGLVTGVVVAAVIAGSGSVDPADETATLVPMLPAILWTLFGWVGGGWLIGTLVHAVGVPDGLAGDEITEGVVVRQRLGSAFSLPVVSVLAILVLVLPAAWVFIQFPAWAPLIAIFISGGIISFAGLSAARPGMKISAGEFLVAASGVGVVVIILVAVLTTQGAGH